LLANLASGMVLKVSRNYLQLGNTLFERWTNSSRFISEFALLASLQDELQISPGSWDHFSLCV
jgi:hypothetical protein